MFSKSSLVLKGLFFLFLFNSLTSVNIAQDKKLTFDQVYMFSQPHLLKRLPSLKGWLDDNHYLQKKSDDSKNYLMKVDAETGDEEIYVDYSKINENLPDGWNASDYKDAAEDYRAFLYSEDDDLYFYSVNDNELKRLTDDEEKENNPSLSPDGKQAAFTKLHNLYVVDTETGKITQLTFDGSDVVYNGWASWVYMEEILGRATRHKAYWWSPNSKMIAFLYTDESNVPNYPLFSSEGIHGKLEWERYPYPGDSNPMVKLGIVNLQDNKTTWIKEDENIDQYTAWPLWTPDSKELFYQVLNRGQDTLQIFAANPSNGKNRTVYTETQPSWVEFFEDLYILKDGSGFILRSDKDGWRQLYYYDMQGNLINRITEGDWTVSKIKLVDEQNRKIYFEGSVHNSLNKQLYCVNFNGDDFEQLTSINGWHSTTVSPHGKYFYDTYSNINQPPRLELFNSAGKTVRLIADRKTELFDEYNLGKTELLLVPTEDGYELPAMWILPPDFDKTKKYPVIFSVYGGPGYQGVKNNFSAYLNRFFIAQNGIIYFSVDHRGSAHFGKKGESLMYRNLGKWEMHDYIEAVKWLKQQPFIDTTKIGITGGSYGGYVTCMALTYGADYFNYGVAEYSVTDWRLYDDIYTERYMDTPEENPDGYEFGSAITHADKYKGKLLITHGTMDDNVHMQNTLQLINKLIDLDKDFELMLYPGARHGIGFPKWIHSQRNKWNFWFRNFFGKEFVIE